MKKPEEIGILTESIIKKLKNVRMVNAQEKKRVRNSVITPGRRGETKMNFSKEEKKESTKKIIDIRIGNIGEIRETTKDIMMNCNKHFKIIVSQR